MSKDHGFEERVAGQAVGPMESRTGAFANGIEVLDAGLTPAVGQDAAAHVVGRRHHGDRVTGDVDAQGEALLIDIGKALLQEFHIAMADVEKDAVIAASFSFRCRWRAPPRPERPDPSRGDSVP